MSELTLAKGNFSDLAEAMGMKQDQKSQAKKSTLARLKILHAGINQQTVIKNKKTEYVAVEAGVYQLELEDGTKVYQKDPKIRLFLQRFMYQRYIPSTNNFVKSIMASDLKNDLPDTNGTFNCGRQSGYVEDYNSLPQEQKDVDRVRTIFGEIYFDKPIGEDGEALDNTESKSIAFISDFKKEGFRVFENLAKDIMAKQKLFPQCVVQLNTETRTGQQGKEYFVPSASIIKDDVELSVEDQANFKSFMSWVDNNNEYILDQHGKNGGESSNPSKLEEPDEPATIAEPKKKELKKPALMSAETSKQPKDLESVMNAWTAKTDDAA